MDLELYNFQSLICHKTKTNKQTILLCSVHFAGELRNRNINKRGFSKATRCRNCSPGRT